MNLKLVFYMLFFTCCWSV